jgi:hypothetical protein
MNSHFENTVVGHRTRAGYRPGSLVGVDRIEPPSTSDTTAGSAWPTGGRDPGKVASLVSLSLGRVEIGVTVDSPRASGDDGTGQGRNADEGVP